GAVPTVSLEALTAAAREENRQAARKITSCYRVHYDWITRDTKHKHYSRYGRTEMAVALGCSAMVAESYVSVGVALHTRLPLLKAAFEAGEIDLPRVRTACRILDNLSDNIVTRVEAEVVEAARRSSPGPLEQAIWDILLRVAPEEAAALREFAKKFRTVTYTPAGELTRIRAELTAPEAAAAWQLLEEMADTLCPKDPRGKKERLCDAFMAPHARRTPTGMPVPTGRLSQEGCGAAGSASAVDDDHRRHRHPHRTTRQPRLPGRARLHRPRSRAGVGPQQSVADPAHRSSDPRREAGPRRAEPGDGGLGTSTEGPEAGTGLSVGYRRRC
ncbi:DUF222 domain-containing protein, partial [Rhodococcus sp. BS-15]